MPPVAGSDPGRRRTPATYCATEHSAITDRAPSRKRARSASSPHSRRNAARRASGRSWGKTSPHLPATRSGAQPTRSETMGRQPKFIASFTTSPQVSEPDDGSTITSATA